MVDVSAGVAYGKITGRFVAFEADGSDAGELPDELPLEGSVTLTPVVNIVRWPTLTPPKIAVVRPIICRIVNGDLLPPVGTTPGVTLVATDQPLGEPDTIQWTAKFTFTGAKQQPAEITFNVAAGTTTDFSTIVPVPALTPVVHVVSTTDRVAAENAAAAAIAAADSIGGGVAAAVETYLTAHPVGGATDMNGITDATTLGKGLVRAANAAAAKTLLSIVATDVTDSSAIGRNILKAADANAVKTLLSISLTAAGITDSTTVGRAVMTATDQAAARTAIGAPAVGTGATDAKAGNYAPAAADISDSTAVGRNLLKAADAAAAWTVIRAAALGTTSTTARAGDWKPAAADVTDSTAVGRALLTAGSQSAARDAIGALQDSDIVHLSGAESLTGVKTFSSAPVVPDASFAIAKTAGLQTALDTTVKLTGAQTIAGVKTFTDDPVFAEESIQQSAVIGLVALVEDVADLASGTANVYTRDYVSGSYPVRGTLPAGAVVYWRGPSDHPPPIGGLYATAVDRWEVAA